MMMLRRDFLQQLAGFTAALLLPSSILATDRLGPLLPQRLLGNTTVTMLGLGGYHIGRMDPSNAQATIETALAEGVRFFDTAAAYQNGQSEEYYGTFLTPKYRDAVFLMTKSSAREPKSLRRQLDQSRRRLNTDYLDLWQLHAVKSPKDASNIVKNKLIDVMLEAKTQGKVRHIGCTGHQSPEALRQLIEHHPVLTSCQMPLNVCDPSHPSSFSQQTLPTALQHKVSIIAMKTLAGGHFFSQSLGAWRTDDPMIPPQISAQEALTFVWSLPIATLVSGADSPEMIREKAQWAKSFAALDAAARLAMVERVATWAANPEIEYYKK